jgi:hypothetical protein
MLTKLGVLRPGLYETALMALNFEMKKRLKVVMNTQIHVS